MWQELFLSLTRRTILNHYMFSPISVGCGKVNPSATISTKSHFNCFVRNVANTKFNWNCSLVLKKQIHTRQDELPSVLSTSIKGSEINKRINKAMKSYMERAIKHENFMKEQIAEFEIGKRHLANMMGMDPDVMTQEDIDRAIEYLMPCGVFDKRARPIMKHPNELFTKRKAAEFDIDGRPHHCLFYTTLPNFFQVIHNIVDKMNELNKYEDHMIEKQILIPSEEFRLNLSGSQWFNKEQLEEFIIEKIDDNHYNYFLKTISRLCEHPYSFRVKDFIMQFRKLIVAATKSMKIEPLQYIGKQPYAAAEGFRKTAKANVIVYGNGTGKVKINDSDLSYFDCIQDREQIMFPLQFTGLMFKVDLEVTVDGTGLSCQAGAVRHGLSQALCSFVSADVIEKMRLAGLLTRDRRTRERKKPGQKGARAKYTWKKR